MIDRVTTGRVWTAGLLTGPAPTGGLPVWAFLLWAVGLACTSACGGGPDDVRAQSREPRTMSLSVFAASSLTDAFSVIAKRFEAGQPGVRVVLTFAGSQALRTQLQHGARADVFASADRVHAGLLREAGLVDTMTPFAAGSLAVIVPRANPAGISRFEQLAHVERLLIGDPAVPVGRYTAQLFKRSEATLGQGFVRQLRTRVVSREPSARMLTAKVALGEADAAIVYRTDALATRDVRLVEIPAGVNARAEYLVGKTASTGAPSLAKGFISFLCSTGGQRVLRHFGFEPVSDAAAPSAENEGVPP